MRMNEKTAWELLSSAKAALEDAEQKLNILATNTEEALAQLRALPALITTR